MSPTVWSTKALCALSRTALVAAALCALAGAWLTVVAPGASAMAQDGITMRDGEVVERSYPAIPSSNPSGEAKTPEICETSVYCDIIPLEVVVSPDRDPEAEYFIQVELRWETERAPGDPLISQDGYTLNDLDMYVYTDPASLEEAEERGHTPNSTSDPYVASGSTAAMPELARLYKPQGDYSILVMNYVGANTGYDLTISWINAAIPTPFEKLADEFAPSTTTTTLVAPTTTTTPTTAPAAPTTTVVASPTLEPVEIGGDGDFDAGDFDTSGFEEQLAAPAAFDLDPVADRTVAPPSGLALVFWLLAVPLTVVGVGGTVLLRRRAVL